jgi:hypothetical protein
MPYFSKLTDSKSESGPDENSPTSSRSSSPPSSVPKSSTISKDPQRQKAGQSNNTIGARIAALLLFEDGTDVKRVTIRTRVSRSTVYKIREKAVSRGWEPGTNIETWHIDDAPRPRR